MVTTSIKAADRLREELINKCFEAGIGFRVLVTPSESGEASFSIKIDRQHQDDKVMESNGIKVLLDSVSAAQIGDYQLDYQDKPDGEFFLMITGETRNERS